jgi:TM2 domain-containing membrane protein YozV
VSELKPLADLFMTVAFMRERDWASAASAIGGLEVHGSGLRELTSVLSSLNEQGAKAPYKNPAVAGLLSTLVPGAGQTYTYHYVDGIQAFGLVGAFAFMSFVAYRYEDDRHGHPGGLFAVSASITSLFHLANIVGANKTAQYHNMRLSMNPVNAAFREVDGHYRSILLKEP